MIRRLAMGGGAYVTLHGSPGAMSRVANTTRTGSPCTSNHAALTPLRLRIRHRESIQYEWNIRVNSGNGAHSASSSAPLGAPCVMFLRQDPRPSRSSLRTAWCPEIILGVPTMWGGEKKCVFTRHGGTTARIAAARCSWFMCGGSRMPVGGNTASA